MKPKIFVVTKTPKGLSGNLSVTPYEMAQKCCAIINVADSPCATFDYQLHVPSFWFPINEIGQWGHYPFFGALRVVNQYYKGDKPVLIHCHAGANRSPSVAFAILLAKGYTVQEAEESLEYEDLHEVFQRNLTKQHIPQNIIQFLEAADVSDGDDSLYSVLRKMDGLYEAWSQKKFAEQNDYTLTGDGDKQARLIYDKETKRFVVKKDCVEPPKPNPTPVTFSPTICTPFIDPPRVRPEWQTTPIVPKDEPK
jgi:hypothetical protein